MLGYIEYLAEYINIPSRIMLTFVVILAVMQLIGEFLSFKGKTVPVFMKVWTNHKEKKAKQIRLEETLEKATKTLEKNEVLFNDIKSHYSEDNITKRDDWMKSVNEGIANNKLDSKELKEKIDETFAIALSTYIENQRNTIINFANRIANGDGVATHEEFRRVFKVYEEYEETNRKYNLKNGQVEIAYRMITDEYENRLRDHAFIENMRGYEY